MTLTEAEAEKRIKQLEEEITRLKGVGAAGNPAEQADIRKELRVLSAKIDQYREEVRNIPVVTAEEAEQIYKSDQEELYACPNCNYALKGNEEKCPGCGDPITWQEA